MKTAKGKRILKKVLKNLAYLLFLFLIVLLTFEVIYRNQIIDTYRPELDYFNSPEELNNNSEKPSLLILGDSYTAGNYTYAFHLKSLLPSHRVINSGISGTGILQTNFIAPTRIKEFKPKTVIYQIYTGNDLLDLSYPVNWKAVSPLKNLYWLLAERLRGLAFLNYRLGQMLRSQIHERDPNSKDFYDTKEVFDSEKYSPREKAIIAAEPDFLQKTLYLQGNRKKDGESLLEGLKELENTCIAGNAKLILLIVPHPAQLTREHETQFLTLGGQLEHPPFIPDMGYDFDQLIVDDFKGNENVQVINSWDFLVSEAHSHPVYFTNDPHLNPDAQRALAEYLLTFL